VVTYNVYIAVGRLYVQAKLCLEPLRTKLLNVYVSNSSGVMAPSLDN
jgi:hypothetical protein